jgi:hypothetical protein
VDRDVAPIVDIGALDARNGANGADDRVGHGTGHRSHRRDEPVGEGSGRCMHQACCRRQAVGCSHRCSQSRQHGNETVEKPVETQDSGLIGALDRERRTEGADDEVDGSLRQMQPIALKPPGARLLEKRRHRAHAATPAYRHRASRQAKPPADIA